MLQAGRAALGAAIIVTFCLTYGCAPPALPPAAEILAGLNAVILDPGRSCEEMRSHFGLENLPLANNPADLGIGYEEFELSTPAGEVLARLRMCKDDQELAKMRRAVEIAQQGFGGMLPLLKAGMTEREAAAELTIQMLRAGADSEAPFSPTVGSGPNSANPHYGAGIRRLQPGDLAVVDWGASFEGYCSDLTRTLAVGEVDETLERIARVTVEANAAGRAAGKPGVPAGEVDRAARAVIESAGFGAQFFHRTGHGIGMEGHEEPYIFGENGLILEEGMTYTVEPGIYFSGTGGVRVEDDVVVTARGSESLSDLPRDLYRIG